eukprot:PhF_6_TR4052/c0_g1_i1/m.5548
MGGFLAPTITVLALGVYVMSCSLLTSSVSSTGVTIFTILLSFYVLGSAVQCVRRGPALDNAGTNIPGYESLDYSYILSTGITPNNHGAYTFLSAGVMLISLWCGCLLGVGTTHENLVSFDDTGASCAASLYALLLVFVSVMLFLSSWLQTVRLVLEVIEKRHSGAALM